MVQIPNTQAFGSGNINCGNITNSNNTFVVNQSDDEDSQIKQWLSPLEPQYRHQSVQSSRVDGVGGWLLETNEFREWSGSQDVPKQAVLFCYGDPGVGKTHISSLVIDWLCDNRDAAVAGLYCDYLAQEEQSATNMLGAILKQILEREGIPGSVRQAFRKAKRGFGGRAVQLMDLVKFLKMTIASLPEVFICIDGIDECLPSNRQELLELLQDIVQASPTTRVFLSWRSHIQDEAKRYFPDAIMIPVVPATGDIERYLKLRLDKDTTPSAMHDDLRAEIMRAVPERIAQSFLLVSLNIEAVLEEVTIHRRKKKLDQMTQGNGLQDAYAATLERVKAQKGSKSRLGMDVLMWLSHSERPLNVDELCQALGIEIGSTDLNSENVPAIETLLGCSLGLAILEESSRTVRLVHYTLQEYLSENTGLFHSPHSVIAEVCLTFLNFQYVRELPPIPAQPTPATPLLEYASWYWGIHASREMTESVHTLALRLLGGFDKHVSSGILISRHYVNWDRDLKRSSTGFTALHCAAYVGIYEIAVAILEVENWDLSATDEVGNTAISWAARNGHGEIVWTLLQREDVAPDTADKDGRTTLSLAAGYGRGDIVQMLLEREDVAPDTADKYDRTPLSWAAEYGRGDVVYMLLEREAVTPDTADKDGRTPLSWAAETGRGDIVQMLLEREDVAPDTADKESRTPLSWAAANGRGDVVYMLLEREEVTPDTADKCDRTPLSWASEYGRGDIVQMLLARGDVTPDTTDKEGRTPLSRAAETGRGDVVKMFLDRKDIIPGTADKDGWTLLSWAAANGRGDVVQTLLEREDVTPDTIDKEGRTPLSRAAETGRGDVVQMLLEREDVTTDTTDKDGRTPLSWAAENGRGDVAQMLLEREDIAPNTTDKYGRTPLFWAAQSGHENVVQLLLEREDVTPDIADKDGRTPLSIATEHGHTSIVEVLQNWRSVGQKPMTDLPGTTALELTSENRHASVVKRVLGGKDSVRQSAGDDSAMNPFPADLSWSSSALPNQSGDLNIHDKRSSPDEPSPLQYHPAALLNYALNSPLLSLLLSFLCVLLLRTLAIYLLGLVYPITPPFHP